MEVTQESMTIEAKLEQIPPSFRDMVKEELKKEISKLNPSLLLDPDNIHVNITRDTTVLSETLADSLLKKSIGELALLSDNLAGLYSHTTDVNRVNKVTELNITDVKNSIDRLNNLLIDTYRKQIDDFCESTQISIPQELQEDPVNKFLKILVESSSLIERAYQVDTMYPNLKQTIISYFSNKLKNLYNKDISPSAVRVLIFKEEENKHSFFLDVNLIDFVLNYSWCSHALSTNSTLQVKISLGAQNLKLDEIVKDILTIQSQHQTKLDLFWEKNFTNYQVLAKFSYLRTLLEQQQNSEIKLSEQSFKLALKAMGFSQEKIETINELDPKEIPLDILETSLKSNDVEVSCLFINNQAASDILKICDTQTGDVVVYIPDYTPSFIEAMNVNLLTFWIIFQIESPDKLAAIASHFSHSIRMANDSKIDAFIYLDHSKDLNAFLSSDDSKQNEVPSQGDIFSLITERQKMRVSNDLRAFNTQSSIYENYYSDYQSTNFAFFTTITAAIQYIPYLLPNIHDTVSPLKNLFPSPYITASEFMKKAVKDKLGLDIDPDQTFIRFSLHEAKITISDSMIPPAFAGQKASTTIQSLTEAALSNYREETSFYGYTTIIYQDLSGKTEYRSSDQELSISPKDIEEIIKAADLDVLHKNILDSFWKKHTDRIKYFIKYRFLQQALESLPKKNSSEKSFKNPPQKKFKSLSKKNLNTISEVVFNSLFSEEETLSNSINPHICLEAINIAGYSSTDMFLFRDKNQQEVILHIAGYSPPFFVFDNYENCICSLEEQAKEDSEWRELMSLHFSMDVQESVINALKQGPYIDGSSLATAPFPKPADCLLKNVLIQHPITTKPIEESFFEAIQKNIQERSYLDAETIMTSDRELMLKRIISTAHFIEIALFVPSFAFPILNWGTFAALVTEIIANLYIAKNGNTIKERHQAAIDVGMNSIGCILIAFFSSLSLKLSKNQHEILMQDQEELRSLASGSGVFSFSRKTPISEELFFDTTKSMKVWQIADSDGLLKHLDVKAWFLDEQFLLFTGKTKRAKHLIISSHGGYLPRSGIVKVPKNTELVVLGPHGWQIFDPGTTKIAQGLVLPYGIINETTALPTQTALYPSLFSRSANTHIHPRQTNIKLLAGTNAPGHIRNYTLSKYQKFGIGEENYLSISQVIHHSRHPFPDIYKIGFQPVDILTIRNRGGKTLPELADIFKSLENHGIHYDRITLEFCRSKISSSVTNPALKYIPAKKFSL